MGTFAQPLKGQCRPSHVSREFLVSLKASTQPHPAQRARHYTLPIEFRKKYGTVQDSLGCGANGHVFSAVRRSDRTEVAVKLLPKRHVAPWSWVQDPDYGFIPREVQILKDIKHKTVIGFYDLYQDEDNFVIVMELFGASWRTTTVKSSDENPLPLAVRPLRRRAMDLFELLEIKKLSEDETRNIFIQLVECLDHLQAHHQLIHGDIKDENVLIDWIDSKPIAKLIDFGGAVIVDSNHRCMGQNFAGTLEYAPPEVVLGQSYDPEKADCWSLGVLLYSMINRGCGPFADAHATAYEGYQQPKCSTNCRRLISELLNKQQRDRPTFKEILSHPWVVNGQAQHC
ncbi:kinase-like domain-containing protein [Powellomyces hirtus]|nr:kinase-like domain-containing protein [Powellomyces hirtus]